jgi:hypothetical protein
LTHSAAATIDEIDHPVVGSTGCAPDAGKTGRATVRFGLRHCASNRWRCDMLPV